MLNADLPQWLDKIDFNTVAVFTLDDGERITARERGSGPSILAPRFKLYQSSLNFWLADGHRSEPDILGRQRSIDRGLEDALLDFSTPSGEMVTASVSLSYSLLPFDYQDHEGAGLGTGAGSLAAGRGDRLHLRGGEEQRLRFRIEGHGLGSRQSLNVA